jgi:hypothetical protein
LRILPALPQTCPRLLGDPLFWRATATSFGIGAAAALLGILIAGLMIRARHSSAIHPPAQAWQCSPHYRGCRITYPAGPAGGSWRRLVSDAGGTAGNLLHRWQQSSQSMR